MEVVVREKDHWFKSYMYDLATARNFFRAYLYTDIGNKIQWENLSVHKYDHKSIISKLFGNKTANMVYKALHNDNHICYITCHFKEELPLDDIYSDAELYDSLIYIEHRRKFPDGQRPTIISIFSEYPQSLDDIMPTKSINNENFKRMITNTIVWAYTDEEVRHTAQELGLEWDSISNNDERLNIG